MARIALTLLAFSAVLLGLHASKLNVARVLLPIFDDFATNFTINATDDSCYRWSTTRDDIIKLTPVDEDESNNCSTMVIVSTLTKDKCRQVADVLAEDLNTNQYLRCVVIVDVINSLSITTTTKELILEEAPEMFEVRAYDNQGNEFSTLSGIELDWTIKAMGPRKDQPVLRIISFEESPYETPDSLQEIECKKKRGHKILLEGAKTGISKVSVKLPHKEYAEVKSNEVQLCVVANMHIVPSEVYILAGDVVSFKIIHTSYGKSEEIVLKNSQYYLDVEDKGIAISQKYDNKVKGLREGSTKIVLHDKNIDMNEPGLKHPSAILNVVKPGYMTLALLPYRNWAALISEQHDIVAEVYTTDDHKISLGPEVTIQTRVGEAFHMQERTANGSWQTGWTQEEGVAPVDAVLETVSNNVKLDPALYASATITIYPRIMLIPSEVILPWDEQSKPRFDFEIQASGGDGKFLWSSSNHSVGAVNQFGRVHTFTNGYFEVSAAMQQNHHNRQFARIHILPPTNLEIIEFVMEAEIGAVIFLHVALYAEKKTSDDEPPSHIPFTKCQDLPFKIKMTDPKFNYKRSMTTIPVGISCGTIAIVSEEVGNSKVTVSYTNAAGVLLSDTVSITYFEPLRLVQPKGQVVLAVGTSTNLIFTGGPKFIVSNQYTRRVESSNTTFVQATDNTNKHKFPSDNNDYSVVNVVCMKLGKSDVTMSTSNMPSLPNCKNHDSTVKVEVICSKPRMIELQPVLQVADAKLCPMDLSSDRVIVQSAGLELLVTVRDDQGRAIMNITSYKIEWTVSNKGMATFGSAESIFESDDAIGSARYFNRSTQKLKPKVDSGEFSVKAQLMGYRKAVTNAHKVTPEWPEYLEEEEKGYDLPPIFSNITLFLVDDTVVIPSIISVYNHPSNNHFLDVKQGSGYYKLALSSETVAEVKYVPRSRQLDIKPLSDGTLTIKLIDLCLASAPALIEVTVVSVRILRVEMSDKVEKDKCISAIVRMYDEYDNLLTVPNLDLVELDYKFENNIAFIEREPLSWSNLLILGEVHFIVTGIELGDTKLVFSIGEPDFEEGYVVSAPMDLQVFPPLKLYPRNMTLAVGAQIQYKTKGGPQPIPTIEYSSLRPDIANISCEGILKAESTGDTKVQAKAVGMNPTTGQNVIYAQDQADVSVIKLKNIKIFTPLNRVQVGTVLPMWASALPDQISPLILGSIDPSIKFEWSVADTDIAKINGPLRDIGLEDAPENLLSIRLTALTAGITKVKLKATAFKPKQVKYENTIDFEVYEKLVLIAPPNISCNPLRLAPHSEFQLQTNMDGSETMDVTYKLLGSKTPTGTDVQKRFHTKTSGPVSVTPDGLLQSYDAIGSAMVVVTAEDNSGLVQTLTIPIEVKPIHYMLLTPYAKWTVDANHSITSIPLGAEFELKTSFYDNNGNRFTAATVELQTSMSRYDLVKVTKLPDNTTFLVSSKRVGVTSLKVCSEENEKTTDYLKLNAQQVIEPIVDRVVVGDVVCFASPLLINDEQGYWSTTDGGTIMLTHDTGIAVVLKRGQANVHHNLHPAAPLKLTAYPITSIVIDSKTGIVSNPPGGKNKVHLLLIGDGVPKRSTNMLTGWNCSQALDDLEEFPNPVICKILFENVEVVDNPDAVVDPYDVFTIGSKFDSIIGKYYCELASTPDSCKKYNTMTATIVVTASVLDVAPQSTKLKFISAVNIPDEITLDDSTFRGVLIITGLEKVLSAVKVSPMDDSIISVYDRYLDGTTLTYTVELIDFHRKLENDPEFMSVQVVSKITKQDVKVMIKVRHAENLNRQCGLNRSQGLLGWLHANRKIVAVIVAIVLVILATLYFYNLSRTQPCINVNVTRMNSCGSPMCGTPTHACFIPQTRTTCLTSTPINCGTSVFNRSGSPQERYLGSSAVCAPLSPVGSTTPDNCGYTTRAASIRHNRSYM